MMKHLKEVNENYFVHMYEACLISFSLFVACIACLVHAFIPSVFTKTASSTIRKILQRTDDRYAG